MISLLPSTSTSVSGCFTIPEQTIFIAFKEAFNMFIFSISSTSTQTILFRVLFFIMSYIDSRFFAVSFFESLRIAKSFVSPSVTFSNITAAAKTPPAAGPLPASSVPITCVLKLLSNSKSNSDVIFIFYYKCSKMPL